MEATLKFTLPEEESEFKAAKQGMELSIAVYEYDQKLRGIIKYQEERPEQFIEGVQKARDLLWEIMNENGLSIDG